MMIYNAVIIPTLNPSKKLIDLVKDLKKYKFKYIVVVDDGSKIDCDKIFKLIESMGCYVYHHSSNLGKGSAIKTGIKNISMYSDVTGFITADADGQHLAKDIYNVSLELNKNKDKLILGVRDLKFNKTPFRSKLGNIFSSIYFFINTFKFLKDTQTGLRGIPICLKDYSLNVIGDRYEYEMNYLLDYSKKWEYIEVPIETIYEDNNSESHFNFITDSIIIYKTLIKYLLVVLSMIILNNILVKLLNNKFSFIIYIVLGIYSFIVNNYWTFNNKNFKVKMIFKYFGVFIMGMVLFKLSSIYKVLKVIMEIILLLLGYIIEKNLIFYEDSE